MAALPGLVVNLGLNYVDFISGLTKAQYEAKKSTDAIAASLKGIGHTITEVAGLLGVGFGIHEIVSWAKEVTLAAEELQHLSDQTGSSVEELSRLSNIVKISGQSVEVFQKQIDRLAAGLNGSEELSTKTAKALQFLGIQSKDPATAMQEIANKLNQFSDGAGKAAIARDLFSKSGVAFLAQLKAIAEETDVTATKTAEQARQAEELARTFRRLEVESHSLADAFFRDVAPALEHILQLLVAATKETGGFFSGLAQAVGINPFGNISRQITETRDKIAGLKSDLGKGDTGLFAALNAPTETDKSRQKSIDSLEKQLRILQSLQTAQVKANDPSNFDHFDRALKQKPLLGYISGGGAGGSVDDPTKKLLEGQLKAIEEFIARERDLLNSREQLINLSSSQGYLSIKDSFDRTQEARDEALRNTVDFYDQEIALQRAYIARSGTTEVNRADALNKIADYQAKQSKAYSDANNQAQILAINREIADKNYAKELDELNAKMAELAGNTAKAAAIRFDASTSGFRAEAQFRGDTKALADQDAIKQTEQVQKNLSDETRKYQLILGDVAIAQGYINLAQSTGAIDEIAYLERTSELNKSKLVGLQLQLDKMREIASSPFATAEQIQQVKLMELEVARLAASTDLLADKFNKTFGDAFSTAFSDFITGTKTAREAFNDFVKSVTKSISDLASQNIAQALFGKGGFLSGAGDIVSKIFGGKLGGGVGDIGVDTGALALTSAATLQTTAATGLLSAGIALNTAAIALSASATASAIGSSGSGIGSLFGTLFGDMAQGGGLAGGTDFARGGLTLVGEHGPEIVNVPRGSQVFPSGTTPGGMGGRLNLSIVVNVPQGTSGPSADQIGIRVGAHVNRALARNG